MVSVIIPVYNAAYTLERAVLSVLEQTSSAVSEIILVNDGSTDESLKIIQQLAIRYEAVTYISQDNQGVSAARNRGLKQATGEYIALLDADDYWLPEKIEKQIEVFQKFPEVDFLVTLWNREQVTWPYTIEAKLGLIQLTLKKLLVKITGQTSTAVFKSKVLENTGFFDENQRYSEDANYWLRVSENNKMWLLPEHLAVAGDGKKSFGASGLSANLRQMEKGIQKNILEMYRSKRINLVEYLGYFLFSKFKYFLRPLRSKI